jgi:hypothetical protein
LEGSKPTRIVFATDTLQDTLKAGRPSTQREKPREGRSGAVLFVLVVSE